jgi:hypothetical protein
MRTAANIQLLTDPSLKHLNVKIAGALVLVVLIGIVLAILFPIDDNEIKYLRNRMRERTELQTRMLRSIRNASRTARRKAA